MNLFCKKCNELLTLCELNEASSDELEYIDAKELLDDGEYIAVQKTDYSFGIPISILINSDSLNLKDHEDGNRFFGCCGAGNFDVFNQVCPKCSAEIGVYIADCWTSIFIGVDGTKISVGDAYH